MEHCVQCGCGKPVITKNSQRSGERCTITIEGGTTTCFPVATGVCSKCRPDLVPRCSKCQTPCWHVFGTTRCAWCLRYHCERCTAKMNGKQGKGCCGYKPIDPDNYHHKQVGAVETACGRTFTEGSVWDNPLNEDGWAHVDCKDCKAKRPETVHAIPEVNFLWWEDPKRWTMPSICGAKADGFNTATITEGGVNCLDCLRTLAADAPDLRHFCHLAKGPDYKHGRVHSRCGLKLPDLNFTSENIDDVECPDCHVIHRGGVRPSLFDDLAEVAAENTLVAARKEGYSIVTGECSHCADGLCTEDSICIGCAFGRRIAFEHAADLDPEQIIAQVLGKDDDWVLAFLAGFLDSYDDPIQRQSPAAKIGRKLRRKHVA